MPIRDPRRRRPRRRSTPNARWPSTPPSCVAIREHFAGARPRTRPTSSWRRSPRRGASTAPTRRSGPRSPSTADRAHARCCASSATPPSASAPSSCARRSSATPGSSRSLDGATLALKAETHNHPSAVEPFGGANTGVGGVIRDVLGAGHRPIAVTDVLCFGPPISLAERPRRRAAPPAHPPGRRRRRRRLRQQDRAADGRRRRALRPRVHHQPARVLRLHRHRARRRPPPTGPYAGDRVVVLGGATGRDGIRGATFSSAAMDATTGEVAGASVQIGDPITEKLLIDVLDGAGDLWTAITDCGAGGLSSAVGEMAEGVGADVELDAVPLKYPGLEPWEIWLSEAQERMVLAVAPRRRRRARERVRGATASSVTDIGDVHRRPAASSCAAGGVPVLDLATEFLHDGRPQRSMTATAPRHRSRQPAGRHVDDPAATLLALLAHPNIASKAADRPPLRPRDRRRHARAPAARRRATAGHADGVVLAAPDDDHGIAVGIGVNPWHGLHDPEAMAAVAVDEAIRNVVAVGADPDRVALLDNFSWGDPRDADDARRARRRRRRLLRGRRSPSAPRSCRARTRSTTPTPAPTGRATPCRRRWSSPPSPTCPTPTRCVTAELRAPGNVLLLRRADRRALRRQPPRPAQRRPPHAVGGGRRRPAARPGAPRPATGALHQAIRGGLVAACHDVSEGGLAVAVAEMCIASGLGVSGRRTAATPTSPPRLFSESGRAPRRRGRRPTTSPPSRRWSATVHRARHGDAPSRCSTIAGVADVDVADARRPRSPGSRW